MVDRVLRARQVRRRVPFVALLCVVALLVAACGDDDGGEAEPGATTTAAGGDTTTTAAGATKASGEPIVIGMINQEDTPAGSFPEIREAAQAAVEYVNQELGGVGGRPLALEVCATVGTPESAAQCANELVEKGVLLVAGGLDYGTEASLPVLEQAGIPYIGGVPLLMPEFRSPVSFQFQGGSAAAFPAQAVYLADVVKATKVNILYVDNPPGLAAADAFGRQVLAKKGVTDVRLIPEKADTADFTAALTAASEGDPDAIMVLFPASGCGRIMQAKQALGVDALTFYPGSCLNRDVLETGGEGAEGAYFNSELLLFSDEVDPEVATYREKLEQYGPGTHELSMFSQVGFLTVMNIVEVLNEVGDPAGLTSQAVIDHMRTLKDHHSFMAHPYTCDAKQVAILPAICSTHERIVQYRDGQAVDVLGEWLTGADQIG